MKVNVHRISLLIYSALALICPSLGRAVTYTATNNANWNVASTWDPNGVPASTDEVIIPSPRTVTITDVRTTGFITVNSGGTLRVSATATLGDININSGGTLTWANSQSFTFSGNVTNNGNMPSGGGSAFTFTYSGTDKVLSGNISNQVANFTGSYVNLGTLVTGIGSSTALTLTGAGSLTNLGTIVYRANQGPTIGALDCSPVGNVFNWMGTTVNGTPTPKSAAYYDLLIGSSGTTAWVLSGITVAHNLTIVNTASISTWPSDNTVPGTFTYSASSSTASTLPAAFSVGAFNMTSGRITIPAAATLTVTGTGAAAWVRSGGSFTPNATGTVKFTGAAPDINGGFTSLLIDSTAANAISSSSLAVTNSLTIASGASLDVTALSGSAHAMLGAESFFGSGTLKGSVTTVPGSKVYGGADGTYATSHITGDLTMAAGSTNAFDIDTTAAAPHDQLVIDGNLTLNSTRFRLKAPSAGVAIDTANDYTLVTAASITGTPVLQWITAPADSGNYSLVTSGTTIKLHYGGVTPPGSPTLNISRSGGDIVLSWDALTFPGYHLQGQTNSTGIGTGWNDVPGGNVTPFNVTVDPAGFPTFFRLLKP